MGIETILLATSAVIGAGSAVQNQQTNLMANKAQDKLAKERKAQLAAEATAAQQAKKKAETTGQRIGFGAGSGAARGGGARSTFLAGINGSASATGMGGTPPPASARGTLFGN